MTEIKLKEQFGESHYIQRIKDEAYQRGRYDAQVEFYDTQGITADWQLSPNELSACTLHMPTSTLKREKLGLVMAGVDHMWKWFAETLRENNAKDYDEEAKKITWFDRALLGRTPKQKVVLVEEPIDAWMRKFCKELAKALKEVYLIADVRIEVRSGFGEEHTLEMRAKTWKEA